MLTAAGTSFSPDSSRPPTSPPLQPPPSDSRSYASVITSSTPSITPFFSSSPATGHTLYFHPPIVHDSSPIGLCPPGLLDSEILKWKNCIIGTFLGSRPPFSMVKSSLLKQWKPVRTLSIFMLDNGTFVFNFDADSDKVFTIDGGPWYVGRKPVFVRQWDAHISFSKNEPLTIPLWVSFPNLPLHFWCVKGLSIVSSLIGKPLYSDIRTKKMDRLSFAQVCIEIQAGTDLPSSVTVMDGEGHSFVQEVMYEWVPPVCSLCNCFGHKTSQCSKSVAADQNSIPMEAPSTALPQMTAASKEQFATRSRNGKKKETGNWFRSPAADG
ncbi:uncharacterized protein LOC122086634 [Macadamia integrifolia]|uniref:uncharacterized protein LOC122086634 n=1 Tax=Macadamia integrifolia TaxID=60698 RepID=UPI001C4F7032|nr:uncharacterized protein LOC122086634 [Macadamia integrifolia]